MKNDENKTEQQIFLAAQTVFEREGYAGARMQAIADEAGINKAMLHYYFRSKNQLFREVFREGIKQLFPRVMSILNADMPLDKKIQKLTDAYYSIISDSFKLPNLVFSEMNFQETLFRELIDYEALSPPVKFENQIDELVKAGEIRPVQPRDLLVNLLSLILFPVLMRPMIESVYTMNEEEFMNFMELRRTQIPQTVLGSIKLKR